MPAHRPIPNVPLLASYHVDVEVTQKGTKLLPEDGIVLPKYVGAIV
jgi:hypothetical protein